MDDAARRTFVVDEPADAAATTPAAAASPAPSASSAGLIRALRRSVVGERDAVPTPLGPRKATYLDHTATGRALGFIEAYVASQVLPLYANTHTTTSYTGFAAHSFLSEARGIVREALNASDRYDCVLFTGRGATAASNVLAHYLARPVPVGGVSVADWSTSAAGGVTLYECPFPGCGRRYGGAADARLHARTHPDGEQAAHGIRAVAVPPGVPAAAGSGSSSSAAPAAAAAAAVQPVHVVVGPWAHHSSLLPWVEAGPHVRLHLLPQDGGGSSGGATDALGFYRALLRGLHDTLVRIKRSAASPGANSPPPRVVLVFTAASNVTGAMLPEPVVDAVCALAHAHGAVSVWDYAASAPHVGPVDVNPRRSLTLAQALAVVGTDAAPAAALDGVDWGGLAPSGPAHPTTRGAVYFSSHKLTGGPGGPGVLVLKRTLMAAAAASTADSSSHGIVPASPGGGTVFFVHPDGAPRYLANDEEREEAGSPDTLGAVRAALALHTLKSGVGWAAVGGRESAMAAVARAAWATHPNIVIVGDGPGPRTPVVSFVVAAAPVPGAAGGSRTASSPPRLLHHWGLIAALLNDVFGIQARGGCLCAGPYVQSLLGWDDPTTAAELEAALLGKDELLRPGVVRVSFPFYMGHAAFRHVVRAVAWVASHASELLSLYQPVAESGEWRLHRAAAGAAVEAGYASVPPSDVAVTVAPGVALPPHQVIASATAAAASGAAPAAVLSSSHVAAAQRGGWKQHPRRWLQEIRFSSGGDDAGGVPPGVSWPSHRVTVNLREDAAAAEAPVASGGGASAAALPVPESALYRAYEAEARLLVAGLALQRQQQQNQAFAASASASASALPSAAAAAALQHHSPAALLSPRGQPLRWFALAGDVPGQAAAADATAGAVDWVARVRRWAPPSEAAAPADAGAALGGVWAAPPTEFTALLSTDAPTPAQLVAWDGKPVDDSGAEDDGGEGAENAHKVSSSAPQPALATGGRNNKRRGAGAGAAGSSSAGAASSAPPPKRPALAPPSPVAVVATANGTSADVAMKNATSESGSSSSIDRGSRSSPAAAAGASSASSSAASAASTQVTFVRSGGGSLRQDLRRDPARAARVKATVAAISRLPQPPPALSRALSKALGRAIKDFDMIREGDRLLVGLSGGKDSLSLLILLAGLQARAPVSFELAAATVDPQYPGFDPSPLKDFCAGLGIPYHYESQPIIANAGTYMTTDSICAWCSRMKRGILYSTCRREGYNVLVLGQHADDCAESFLMSAFRNGLLRTMKAHYTNDEGDVRIIRPLVYARERLTREFATSCALPIINENCPACYIAPTERYHVKKLLSGEEALNPSLFSSLERAIRPLMTSKGAAMVKAAGALQGADGVAPVGPGGGDDDDDDDDDEGGGGACGIRPPSASSVAASSSSAAAAAPRISQSLLSVPAGSSAAAAGGAGAGGASSERIVFTAKRKGGGSGGAQAAAAAPEAAADGAPASE